MPLHDDPMQAALYGYLAGILDGEGTFTIARSSKAKNWNVSYDARVCAGMTERVAMQMLYDAFGGSLYRGTEGLWRWNITGRLTVIKALPILIPYLHVKRLQAKKLLAFCLDWQDMRQASPEAKEQEYRRREEVYLELRRMHGTAAAAETEREGAREGEATVRTHVKA